MAKRFIDTDIFRKQFMRGLEAPYKALWLYLLCECDHAGIWVVEMDVAQMRMGMKFDEAKAIEKMKGAAIPVDGGSKWYLPDFVAFQYGKLNPANRVHASVLERLGALGIDPENKPLASPLQGAKDKDKDKDTQEREERASETIRDQFLRLWEVFERHGVRKTAAEYWAKLPQQDRDAIMRVAPEYVASTSGDRLQYRKHLEGWINPKNRLWERPVIKRTDTPQPMTRERADAMLEEIRKERNLGPYSPILYEWMPKELREFELR